jgi:hypothetical protein
VVAWNATRESTRAVRDAMPILRRAKRVHLMCLERERDLRHVSRLQLNDARDWLVRHGVELHMTKSRFTVMSARRCCRALTTSAPTSS